MRREGKSNQYYEGLVLSLILDNLDRLDVLAQIAARRWCVLNSTVTHNLSWDVHSALLYAQVVRETLRTTRHAVVLCSALSDGLYAEWFTNVSASVTSKRVLAGNKQAQLRGRA